MYLLIYAAQLTPFHTTVLFAVNIKFGIDRRSWAYLEILRYLCTNEFNTIGVVKKTFYLEINSEISLY